jgi:streptomycin 6-kinase
MSQEDKEIIGPKSVNGSRRLDAANKFFNNKLRK